MAYDVPPPIQHNYIVDFWDCGRLAWEQDKIGTRSSCCLS